MFPAKVLRRSTIVGLVVGTLLNIINQPAAIFGPEDITWWKIGLTYMVPFFVSTYGAMAAMKD